MQSRTTKLTCATAVALSLALASSVSAAPKVTRVASASRAATATRARIVTSPPPSSDTVQTDADHDDEGIFGPLRIGPLAGASVPRPMSLEVFLKYRRAVGIGLEYSFTPTVTVDGVTAHASAVAGDLRWFVLDSPFFLGAGLGVQSLHGTGTVGPYSGTADMSKVFVTPRLGVLFTFGAGFSVGADAGIELPVSHSETVVPAIDQIQNNDLLVAFTRKPLPDVHLVRLGWLF